MKTPKVILKGSKNWKEFRDMYAKNLLACKTQEEFNFHIMALYLSISLSNKEFKEKRKILKKIRGKKWNKKTHSKR